MSSKRPPTFVQNILTSIAKDENFGDYSFTTKSGAETGDGLVSDLLSITLTENQSDKKLNLVCKLVPENESRRRDACSDIFFRSEAVFFNILMPIFAKFQAEKNLSDEHRFLAYPKCYAAIADETIQQFTIILEDLRPLGFKMWKKSEPSPIENVKLVMRELGKFHGLSIALKDQRPNDFVVFEREKGTVKEWFTIESAQVWMNSGFERAINSVDNDEYKSIIQHIKDNYLSYMESCIGVDAAGPFGVLCHSDLWNNNILYRFDQNGTAEDVRLLDFQTIQYGSPAIDLLTFIFSATDKSLRDKEYVNMLKCYHDSLSMTVRSLGSDPDKLFTFQNLHDELKRCGNLTLILAPMLTEILLADSSELSNLDEGDYKDFFAGLSGKDQYAHRLNEVFGDVLRLGYYRKLD